MNYSLSRLVIFLTSILFLNGCFNIPDGGKLNTSWATESKSKSADYGYFIQDSAEQCPQQLNNPAQQVTSLPTEFSLVNWNIYKQDNEGWNKTLNKLASNNDLIVLQEVKLGFLMRQLFDRNQLSWTQVEAFNLYKQPVGVLTASKVAPLSACKNTLSEPWIRFPKSTLMTFYAWEGSEQPLLLINLHAINFTLGADEFNQQLSLVMQAVKQHEGAVILAGDFNTWTNKRLNSLKAMTEEAQLHEVMYGEDVRITAFGNTIDAIFYRGLRQLQGSSFESAASDHNPMIARFAPE